MSSSFISLSLLNSSALRILVGYFRKNVLPSSVVFNELFKLEIILIKIFGFFDVWLVDVRGEYFSVSL